jgi:hypothetical protein
VEPMNLRRGLFRLWLLVAVLWAGSWALIIRQNSLASREMDASFNLWLVCGPPVAIFALGYALLWTFRGFRNDGKGRKMETAPDASRES